MTNRGLPLPAEEKCHYPPTMLPQTLILLVTAFFLSLASTAQATDYYDPFLFEVRGRCQSANIHFMAAYSFEPAPLGLDFQDRPVHAALHLQLLAEGAYWAEYSESALLPVEEGRPKRYEVVFRKAIEGHWHTAANRLELDGLGYGTPGVYRDPYSPVTKSSIRFTHTTVFNDSRILSSTMNLSRSVTNVGPRGISINEYCRTP